MSTRQTYNLAPGNILQNMYLKNRIYALKKLNNNINSFIEVGSGNGNISNILLTSGLTGTAYELNEESCNINRKVNLKFISEGKYTVNNTDFFSSSDMKADIIITSHVIEHFSDYDLDRFFVKCKDILSLNGTIISIVPANKNFWGIEDETCGHYRRFELSDLHDISRKYNYKIQNLQGLTYPLSNLLLGVSNYLVRRSESWKIDLAKDEQTQLSSSGGARNIKFKTSFPYYFRYIINDYSLYPFYLMQLLFGTPENSIVLYFELSRLTSTTLA